MAFLSPIMQIYSLPPCPLLQAGNKFVFHLIEANLELGTRTFSANVKSTQPDNAPFLGMVLRQALNAAHLISMDLI